MTKRIEIAGNNRGKHIGHACEGHLRGLLTRIPSLEGLSVGRSFPFEFHVKPDAVVLDKTGKIAAVFIVAYWENKDNSHMKFHRTRPEYNELSRIIASSPEKFIEKPSIVTVLYGTENGWKPLVLKDIEQKCPTLVFVPSIESSEQIKIWEDAFGAYRPHLEKGIKDPPGKVEEWCKHKVLTKAERRLIGRISSALEVGVRSSSSSSERQETAVGNLPAASYRSRYRQPLSMLSMFRDEEITAYLANQRPGQSEDIDSFIRRATWLDMGVPFVRTRANRETTIAFRLHEPLDEKGEYAPHLPDYSSWKRGNQEVISACLQKHRSRTTNPGKVFRGGTSDQICGNYEEIAKGIAASMPVLLNSIEYGTYTTFANALAEDDGVSVASWHPANCSDVILPVWSFCACAAATIAGERKLRSALLARANQLPAKETLKECYSLLKRSVEGIRLLREVQEFCRTISSGSILDLANACRSRPSLLSNANPCSWLADYYNTIATNSSHNPLNNLLEDWLRLQFPDYEWGKSWPSSRTTSLASIDDSYTERRQWAFIGSSGLSVVCAECKSITANNWGNKSKELYDKTADFRRFCSETGRSGISVLLFDGDLSEGALSELRTGIGHDLVVTCDQVMNELSTMVSSSVKE